MLTLASRSVRAAAGLAVAATTLVSLAACVAEPSPASPHASPGGPPATAEVDSAANPTPTPTRDAAIAARDAAPASARVAARCDNIIDPASDVRVEEVVPPEGADPLPPEPVLARGAICVTDAGLGDFYAWSPATRQEWDAQVASLTGPESGWFTEEGPRGTYLTYKIDGEYAQTYLFTGDAVILAPRKAATDVVIGPPPA